MFTEHSDGHLCFSSCLQQSAPSLKKTISVTEVLAERVIGFSAGYMCTGSSPEIGGVC